MEEQTTERGWKERPLFKKVTRHASGPGGGVQRNADMRPLGTGALHTVLVYTQQGDAGGGHRRFSTLRAHSLRTMPCPGLQTANEKRPLTRCAHPRESTYNMITRRAQRGIPYVMRHLYPYALRDGTDDYRLDGRPRVGHSTQSCAHARTPRAPIVQIEARAGSPSPPRWVHPNERIATSCLAAS